MAIVVAPGGSNGDDLAVASVVKLRPGVDNPIFREIFRAAYDRVACAQAGGVAGSTEHDHRRSRRPRRVLHGRRHDLPRPPRRRPAWCRSRRSARAGWASRSSRTCRSRLRPMSGPRPVRAPRGPELTCRGWEQEAALRMLMNNLDPEVAEDPDHLVVYGGTGRAARSWDAFDAIVRELRALGADETLLVQSGKPVGVVRTHPWAPRVLIANSNLVGKWATWEVFRDLERTRPDDVRPDDRGLVDLHRDPGHPAGHVRDLRGGGPPALRRHAARDGHAHRGSRRDGRRAAARGDHERWRGHRRSRSTRHGPGGASTSATWTG